VKLLRKNIVTRSKIYLIITNLAPDLVPPWLRTNIQQLSSLHVTVRRDRAATSLTHLYNGEIARLRFSAFKYPKNLIASLHVLP
jgi:hypothetical protein